jgi:hypothetical protein
MYAKNAIIVKNCPEISILNASFLQRIENSTIYYDDIPNTAVKCKNVSLLGSFFKLSSYENVNIAGNVVKNSIVLSNARRLENVNIECRELIAPELEEMTNCTVKAEIIHMPKMMKIPFPLRSYIRAIYLAKHYYIKDLTAGLIKINTSRLGRVDGNEINTEYGIIDRRGLVITPSIKMTIIVDDLPRILGGNYSMVCKYGDNYILVERGLQLVNITRQLIVVRIRGVDYSCFKTIKIK